MSGKKRIVNFTSFVCIQCCFVYLMAADIIKSSYFVTIVYNIFVLIGSYVLLKKDYDIAVFKDCREIPKDLFPGLLYALLFSLALFAAFSLFQDVSFLSAYPYGFQSLCGHIIAQLIIAFSEEIFFRVYFYEVLLSIFRRKFPSIFLISLIFAGLHLAMNGNVKQFFVAMLFSLYAFYIKTKRSEETVFLLGWMHFIYNCLVCFVFVI
ncbi:MAG: CPBP family intramembrane metalloprotease [Clostridiales bacterium]|nr:CPBP family intramembrane metalloprotease [Clostridiales bacterium]